MKQAQLWLGQTSVSVKSLAYDIWQYTNIMNYYWFGLAIKILLKNPTAFSRIIKELGVGDGKCKWGPTNAFYNIVNYWLDSTWKFG